MAVYYKAHSHIINNTSSWHHHHSWQHCCLPPLLLPLAETCNKQMGPNDNNVVWAQGNSKKKVFIVLFQLTFYHVRECHYHSLQKQDLLNTGSKHLKITLTTFVMITMAMTCIMMLVIISDLWSCRTSFLPTAESFFLANTLNTYVLCILWFMYYDVWYMSNFCLWKSLTWNCITLLSLSFELPSMISVSVASCLMYTISDR